MNDTIRKLEDIARLIRIDIVTMIHKAGDGHPGASDGWIAAFRADALCGEKERL